MKCIIYSATWCGPCRMLHKTVDAIKAEHPEWYIQFHDIEEYAEEVEHYQVQNLPTIIFFDMEEIVHRTCGNFPKATLEEMFHQYLDVKTAEK